MSWLNLRETTKNIYFVVIVLAGVLMMYAASLDMGSIYGTNTYPVTYQVLDMVSASFALFMMVITTFYAGELVWREREARMGQMLDACPCRTGCPAVQAVRPDRPASAADAWSSCCAAWRSRSSRAIPPRPGPVPAPLFLSQMPYYALIAVLAIFLQVMINQRYIAYFRDDSTTSSA
jgi:hypothetical protein